MFNLSHLNPFSKNNQEQKKSDQEVISQENMNEAIVSLDQASLESIETNAGAISHLVEKIKAHVEQFSATEKTESMLNLLKKYSVPLMIVGMSLAGITEASAQSGRLAQYSGTGARYLNNAGQTQQVGKTDWEKQQNRNMGYQTAGMAGSMMTMSQNENVRNAGVIIATGAGVAQQIDWRISQGKRRTSGR